MWWDNFSKIYAVAIQTLEKGAMRNCLWTSQALHRYVGAPVSTPSILQHKAMPDPDWLSAGSKLLMENIKHIDNLGRNRYVSSLCKKYNVVRVPIKPTLDARTEPDMAAVLAESRDGLVHFFPSDIVGENIGSNRGLLKLLKTLDTDRTDMTEFSYLNVDCNIYMRVLKVCR